MDPEACLSCHEARIGTKPGLGKGLWHGMGWNAMDPRATEQSEGGGGLPRRAERTGGLASHMVRREGIQ